MSPEKSGAAIGRFRVRRAKAEGLKRVLEFRLYCLSMLFRQKRRPIRSPMQDAHDVQCVVVGRIEHHVLAIGMDADRRAELKPESRDLRILQKQTKDSLKSPEIGFGLPYRPAVTGVRPDRIKVAARCRPKPKLSVHLPCPIGLFGQIRAHIKPLWRAAFQGFVD